MITLTGPGSIIQYFHRMFSGWWPWPEKSTPDPQRTYLRVEFLTAEEKASKKKKVDQLEQQFKNDQDVVIPYEECFTASFRFILNTTQISDVVEPIKFKIVLKELSCHLEVTKNQELQSFMSTYVKEIHMFLLDNQMIGRNDVVPLFSEYDTSVYVPSQVLEIIYEPKSLWERIKNRTKKIICSIPKAFLGLLGKILSMILGYFGLGSGVKTLMWKMLPTTTIMQWIISVLSLFFPFLGPLLSIATKTMF